MTANRGAAKGGGELAAAGVRLQVDRRAAYRAACIMKRPLDAPKVGGYHATCTRNAPRIGNHMAFNPKRRIAGNPNPTELKRLAHSIGYGGNPEHKIDPGDFGLTPPSLPESDKSKCDWVGIARRSDALRLLRAGVRRGLVSEQRRGGYPQNVWSVTDEGYPMEAQLENRETGTYHGYPMPETDPFRDTILQRWSMP